MGTRGGGGGAGGGAGGGGAGGRGKGAMLASVPGAASDALLVLLGVFAIRYAGGSGALLTGRAERVYRALVGRVVRQETLRQAAEGAGISRYAAGRACAALLTELRHQEVLTGVSAARARRALRP